MNNKLNMYFYGRPGYRETVINGEKVYRDDNMHIGVWRSLPPAIDRLLDHIQLYTDCINRTFLARHILRFDWGAMARVRAGKDHIPANWLLRMCDYTGLTLKEIRAIGGLEPTMAQFNQTFVKLVSGGAKQHQQQEELALA